MRQKFYKKSRKHGPMVMSSYAPGDGSIDFNWMSEQDPNGRVLNEPVTESDVSEWLELPENKKVFDGWLILEMGNIKPQVRIAKRVVRPFHTSKVLEMDGERYEYIYHGPEDPPAMHSMGNTDIYLKRAGLRVERCKVSTGNALALLFFLNHESDFDKNGYETRRKR